VGETQFYHSHFACKEPKHRFSDSPKVVLEIDGRVGIKTNFITARGVVFFSGRVLYLHYFGFGPE